MKKSEIKKMTNLQKSNLVHKALAPKVTESMLNHELFRFVNASEKELLVRINKIKNPVKAEACRQFAKEVNWPKIFKSARIRRNELFFKNM